MELGREYSVIAADVKRAQSGDRAAMDRIIGDIQDPVYYTCLSILHNKEAAQDVTQDVLCTVFTKLGTLKNPSGYIGWVNRITANKCKNRMAKTVHEVFLAEDEDGNDPFAMFEQTDEQTVPDKVFDNAETQRMILELVNALPDEQRMCVMLYYYDQMKTREIADALDVSEGTVKSRLNYARKTIKEGVLRYEKQGVRLYGVSPIALLSYYLAKAAKANASPVTVEVVRAASGAVSAASSAGSAVGTGATVVTEGAKAVGHASVGVMLGRIGVGVAAAALFFGIGYGIYRSIEIPKRKDPGPGPSASPVAEATVTPESTPDPTSESTPEQTPEPTPELSPPPAPEKNGTMETVRYSLYEYAAEKGFTPAERMTTDKEKVNGKNIICMWNQCYFKDYTGDIIVNGIPRENAMLFYVEYEDGDKKKTATNNGEPLSGSFELKVPEGYERLEFMLGAASVPERFYGSPATHGTYLLRIYVDDEQYPAEGEWRDWTYLSETPIVIDVAGKSIVRFELEQICGKVITINEETYAYNEIDFALNPVIFDVAFVKTEKRESSFRVGG